MSLGTKVLTTILYQLYDAWSQQGKKKKKKKKKEKEKEKNKHEEEAGKGLARAPRSPRLVETSWCHWQTEKVLIKSPNHIL